MKTIGLLVCGAFSDEIRKKYKGVYEDFFIDGLLAVDSSLSFITYSVHIDIFPKSIHECDAWLVTGSKSGAYEDLPWITKLEGFVKEAYEDNVPLIGICFGHQLLASALGGCVEKSPEGWGLGYQEYEMSEPLEGIAGTLNLYAIHQDQVIDPPKEARVIASNDHCPYAALIYKGKAISFQPHPEFSKEFEADLMESIKGDSLSVIEAEEAIKGLEGTEAHNNEIMKIIASFVSDEG